jgi:uncharacterized protein YjdB
LLLLNKGGKTMIFKKSKKVLSAFLSLAMIGTMVASVPFSASAADATTTTPGVSYSVHGQTYGWTQGYKSDGAEAGTDGQSKRVEALKVKLDNAPTGASITYQVHQQSYGWATSAIKSDDAVSGVVGQAKRDEAIRITLSGMPGYSVEYRVHQQTYGWSAWQTTANGTAIANAAIAGVTGKSKRVEALEVKLVAPTVLSVSSVTASSATALKVQFSGAVADTSKYSFKVLRGTTSQTDLSSYFTATWSADKTSATLDYAASIPADTYTVTAASTGTDLSATANSGTAVVVAQTVTKIKITSSELIKSTDATSATASYKIYDQYGNDMTSSVSASSLSLNAVIGSSTGTAIPDPSTGMITVTKPLNAVFLDTDTTGVVTIVYASNGVNTSATMPIAAAASVSSVTFGANILPSGYTVIQDDLSPAVTVPITVVDQYGNTITDTTELAASLKPLSSDPNVTFDYTTDVNGNPELEMDTPTLTSSETVVLTLINPSTGVSWTKNFLINLGSTPTKIAVGDFTTTTLASGDSYVLPLTVTDQFGTTLTKAQIASNAKLIDTWITLGAFEAGTVTPAPGAACGVDQDPNSSTYGELIGTIGATGTYVLVFDSYTSTNTVGNLATKTVTVSDKRIGNYVTNLGNVNLIQGATKAVEFAFKDQYNAPIAYGDVLDNIGASGSTKIAPDYDDYNYNVTLTKLSGDTGAVTLGTEPSGSVAITNGYSNIDVATAKDINVTSNSSMTGSYKLTLAIMDGTSTVSSATATINVTANNVSGLTYSVTAIPTLTGAATADTSIATGLNDFSTVIANNPYAREVVVNAADASGSAYSINTDNVLSVTSSDQTIAKVSNSKDSNGDYVVAGQNLATYYTAHSISGSTPDETATLTIVVNTLDGVKTFTQNVTVSDSAPSIKTLNVTTLPMSSANSATDVSNLTNALTTNYTSIANALIGTSSTVNNVIGEDQYGVWHDINTKDANITATVNSTNYADADAFAFDGTSGKLKVVKGAVATGEDLNVTLFDGTTSIKTVVYISDTAALVLAGAGTPDHTFTLTENTYTPDYANIVVTMPAAINGTTYSVVEAAGTYTVSATGNATANAVATTSKITVKDVKTGVSSTITLHIGAATAGAVPTFTVS